jgi:hypothetical protein
LCRGDTLGCHFLQHLLATYSRGQGGPLAVKPLPSRQTYRPPHQGLLQGLVQHCPGTGDSRALPEDVSCNTCLIWIR